MHIRRTLAVRALLTIVFVVVAPVAGTLRAHAASDSQATVREFAEGHCAACHGADGNSTIAQYPKLAGQTAAYLIAQLKAFRDGQRKSQFMAPVVKGLTDAQIAALADFYADQPVKPDKVTNEALARQGERIFFAPGRGVPACSACHSAAGRAPTGMMGGRGMMGGGGMMGGMTRNTAAVPNLDGQHAAYLTAQLAAFANGSRSGTVMNTIAATLSEEDRESLAQYLSGLR